jgi:PAS domain S-box-containing protein
MLVLDKEKTFFSLFKDTLTVSMLLVFSLILLFNIEWQNYYSLFHTTAEAVCVFISFNIFMLVWYTYQIKAPMNHLISFGFLIVAVFDLLHVLFFSGFLSVTGDLNNNLSMWFYYVGRLFQGGIFIFIIKKNIAVPKGLTFFASVLLIGIICWAIYSLFPLLPALYDDLQNSTEAKLYLEGAIILLFLYALVRIKEKLREKGLVIYPYIFAAAISAIIAELCFMIVARQSVYYLIGHLFKMACYFFFLKGILVSAVQYPYEKAEDNNRFLKCLLNELPIGVTMYNSDIELTFANTKALSLLDCELKDVFGCGPIETGSKFSEIKRLPEVFANGGKCEKNTLIEVKSKNGQRIKLKADYFKLADGYLVLFEDPKNEQDLASLKLQTKTILGSINNLIIITDIHYKIIICNSKTTELLEMEEFDVIGKNIDSLFELLIDDERKKGQQYHLFLNAGERGKFYRLPIVTVKGNEKELLIHTDHIKNIDGEIIGMILTAADITSISIENEKERQNEKLITLGQMAAGIVHEIRNPLTAIKGFSQLIRYKTEDEKISEYAGLIEKETENINRFVTDFLMFAKPSPCQYEDITVKAMIDSIKAMIDTNAFIRRIEVQYEISAGEKKILIDLNKIRQVILNITKNAMEAVCDLTHPLIKVSAEYHHQTSQIAISIYNNGRPMSEEERLMAGTPFFTTKTKGTGLGLCICFQIIREHHGKIEIESSEALDGTKFIIYLPCKDEQQQEETDCTENTAG